VIGSVSEYIQSRIQCFLIGRVTYEYIQIDLPLDPFVDLVPLFPFLFVNGFVDVLLDPFLGADLDPFEALNCRKELSEWHHFEVELWRVSREYLLFAFFFGFVDVDLEPFALDLAPFVDLEPFVVLLPLVDLETLAPFVVDLDRFVADDDLETLVAEALVAAFVAALDPLVALCWSLANNSATEAQPDAAKIRLIVGESSLIWRVDALVVTLVDEREGGADKGGSFWRGLQ